jgi:BirA family biotin operon repressor/biotin-[acetyl-CoA-carboxylase] ligase
MQNTLDPEKIFGPAAGERLIGRDGEVFAVVESTMDTARRLALRGFRDGYVVLAEKQRSGRGRAGAWECPPREGLLMSVILRLGVPRADRRLISILGAVSASEAVEQIGVPARVKWPNDIVVAEKGERLRLRKLGGVLVEPVTQEDADAAPAHILGLGLNVNQDHRHLLAYAPIPATSLKVELAGIRVDRNLLCGRLLDRLDFWYGRLQRGALEELLARWRTLSCLLGETVRADVQGELLEGTVIGLLASGELLLRSTDGRELELSSEKATLLFGEESG